MSIQEEMVNQEPEENIEEAEVIEEPLTKEEKFLGIRTQVEIRKSEKEEDSDLSIEVIDDRPEQDRKKPRSKAQKKSDQAEVEIKYASGNIKKIKTLCRIDTKNELEYYKNGGILQYVLRNMI